MKTSIYNIMKGVVGVSAAAMLYGCAAETPFDRTGEGTVRLRTVVNSITTRAEGDNDYVQQLSDSCVVYISGEKGLVYKKRGLENVDSQITLKSGGYVAEAWTGDSVTASFDKKFYRGYEPFEVSAGSTSNVVVNCRIKNVVASINTATIDPNLMLDDYKVTIKNSGQDGTLEFTKENAESDKAYFMMPTGDTTLEYTIEGTRKDGKPFSKSGTIENVESAHHYILNFQYNPGGDDDPETGGVFIQIIIKDEVLDDTQSINVQSRPTIEGIESNIDKQLNFSDDNNIPDETIVQICAFESIETLRIETLSFNQLGWPLEKVNLAKADENIQKQYHDAGLTWEIHPVDSKTQVVTCQLIFPKKMLEKLEKASEEHVITITVIDGKGRETGKPIRIARSEEAIVVEDPIEIDDAAEILKDNKLAVGAHSASLTFSLADTYIGTPGIEYRKAGSNDEWKFQAVNGASNAPRKTMRKVVRKAPKQSVTISGLEAGTKYEYRAACGDFHSDKVMNFETESIFTLPGASFEDWSDYEATTMLGKKKVILPWNVGDKLASFWGSGNEGAATANMTLTNKSDDMKHTGQYSAKLRSDVAMKIIAAGNLFVGHYVKTDGTNGVLSIGREYNGSHPKELKLFANYRPAEKVTVKSGNEEFVPNGFAGGKDHGQIYVAFTTGPVEIRTNPQDRKLFNKDDADVLAYGEVTWTSDFGPDGALQEVNIPIEWKESAHKTDATHIVIVCSASKYGDYFSGAAGSTMYVDDFELIY